MAQVDLKAIDQYIRKAQIDWEVPGLSMAIVKDGATVLAKGYGVKSMGQNEPVDEHTLFAIASNSKAFTSASLAMLIEAGKLHWDDPVQRYLPFFSLYDPYVSSHATVRDLLCHQLGLGTFSGDVLWYKSHYTAEEVVKRVKHLPQAYEFRSGYGYSNLMFMRNLEKLTNQDMVELETVSFEDEAELKEMIKQHHAQTGSDQAEWILENLSTALPLFVKVMPKDYKAVLAKQKALKIKQAVLK